MSRQTGTQQQVSTSEPWAPQQKHLEDIFGSAKGLYGSGGPSYYGGDTVVPFAADTQKAIDLTRSRALGGSPLETAAQASAFGTLTGDPTANPAFGYLGDIASGNTGPTAANRYLAGTAAGDNLTGNPYLDAMWGNASRKITDAYKESTLPGINSMFSMAGRFGSEAGHQAAVERANETLADSLAGTAAGIYGGEYGQERQRMMDAAGTIDASEAGQQQRQMSAAGALGGMYDTATGRQLQTAQLAPTLAGIDYTNIGKLAGIGGAYEDLQARQQADAQQRHAFGQERPYDALNRYLAAVQGGYGGTGTTVSPLYSNPAAGAVGGGLAGASMAQLLQNQLPKDGYWGAGMAGAGALLGAFA